MAWLYILAADIFEIAWPFALKRVAGLSKWTTAGVTVIFSLPIFFLLGEAVKSLPASTVYASFVGIGIVGTAIVGITLFGESTHPGRLACLALIVAGLAGLTLFTE